MGHSKKFAKICSSSLIRWPHDWPLECLSRFALDLNLDLKRILFKERLDKS